MVKKLGIVILLALSVAGCSRSDAFEIPEGSDVTLQKKDGVTVEGKLVAVHAENVVLQTPAGGRTEVSRSQIATITTSKIEARPAPAGPGQGPVAAASSGSTPAAPAASSAAAEPPKTDTTARTPDAPVADPVPAFREITLPTGTLLPVALQSSVGSDTSNVEDEVRGTLRRAVTVDGVQVLPAGTAVIGHVTSANRSARVKGRASVGFRFNQIDMPGDGGRMRISSGTITHTAPATKKQDAAKIGVGAAGGAIVGGILGGGDGAAKGAAVGGAAGTGVVLSTRGKEVRLGPGLPVSVRLTAPVSVRVRSTR